MSDSCTSLVENWKQPEIWIIAIEFDNDEMWWCINGYMCKRSIFWLLKAADSFKGYFHFLWSMKNM